MTFEQWLAAVHAKFPSLSSDNCRPTSPMNEGYNCIAWAAETTDHWWWPDAQEQAFWPAGVPRIVNLDAFQQAYGTLGYREISNATMEPGKQKVAVFATNEGKPTHASRQLPDGWWASKLGANIDIEHELTAIEGAEYGKVAIVLSRVAP